MHPDTASRMAAAARIAAPIAIAAVILFVFWFMTN
jgi:hypothetical protein